MSNAITSVTNDAMSAYWNPAGLMDMGIDKGVQIGAMHNEWFAGIGKYDYLGIAVPISGGKRALAISGIRFGIDNIPNTLSLYQSDGTINYDNVVEFSAAEISPAGVGGRAPGALHRRRRGAGRSRREALRHDPERHPQRIHGAEYIYLSTGTIDADSS